MIVRTTVTGAWLAAICSIAASSPGLCEVRPLPNGDAALAAPSPVDPAPDGARNDLDGLVLGELTFSAQPQAGASAAPDLRGAPLNNMTEPPQSFWRRLLSAVVQLGAARTSP